jgi:hypothetical protein
LKEDPSSDPSLTDWYLHKLSRLVVRANVAIRNIGFILCDNEAIRISAIPDPRPPKAQVHGSLEKPIDTADKLPLGDLEKHHAETAGHQT